MNIQTAFTVKNGLSLKDQSGIFQSPNDPSAGAGEAAPLGSIILRNPGTGNGEIYLKVGTGDTEWQSAHQKSNLIATTNPTTTDDSSSGYVVGSVWVNLTDDLIWYCVDNTSTTAVWRNITTAGNLQDVYDMGNTIIQGVNRPVQMFANNASAGTAKVIQEMYPQGATVGTELPAISNTTEGTYLADTANSKFTVHKAGEEIISHGKHNFRELDGTYTYDAEYASKQILTSTDKVEDVLTVVKGGVSVSSRKQLEDDRLYSSDYQENNDGTVGIHHETLRGELYTDDIQVEDITGKKTYELKTRSSTAATNTIQYLDGATLKYEDRVDVNDTEATHTLSKDGIVITKISTSTPANLSLGAVASNGAFGATEKAVIDTGGSPRSILCQCTNAQNFYYNTIGTDPLGISITSPQYGFYYTIRFNFTAGIPTYIDWPNSSKWLGIEPIWIENEYIISAYLGSDDVLYLTNLAGIDTGDGFVPLKSTNHIYKISLFSGATLGDKLANAIAYVNAGATIDCTNVDGVLLEINSTIVIDKPITILAPLEEVTCGLGTNDLFDIQSDRVSIIGGGRSTKSISLITTSRFKMLTGRYHVRSRGHNVIRISGMDLIGVKSSGEPRDTGRTLDGSGGVYIEKANPGTTDGGNNSNDIILEELLIDGTYAHGVYIDTPILSSLKGVRVSGCAGHGFFLWGGTSTTFTNCYVAQADYAGFMLYQHTYGTLIGCASEYAGVGYWFRSSYAITTHGCGSEYNGNRGATVYSLGLTTTDNLGGTVSIPDISNDYLGLFRGHSIAITGGQALNINTFKSANPAQAHPTLGTSTSSRHIYINGNARDIAFQEPSLSTSSGGTFPGRFDIEISNLSTASPSGIRFFYNPAFGDVIPVISNYITDTNNSAYQTYIYSQTDSLLVESGNERWTNPTNTYKINDVSYPTTSVSSIVAGTGVSVDNTDPTNPILTNTGYLELSAGAILDVPSMTLVKDTGDWYIDIEKEGGGDLRVDLGGIIYTLDCTTGAGVGGKCRTTTALILGLSTIPNYQYIYIKLNGSTPELHIGSDVDNSIPTASAGLYFLLDDAYTTTNGPLYYHNYITASNHGDAGKSLLIEVAERVHESPPRINSGIETSVTITPHVDALDDLEIGTTPGIIYQLHRQDILAYTPPNDYIIVNDPITPFKVVSNLNELTLNALGDPLYSNNRYFDLTFAVSVSSDGNMHFYVWLPTGSYANLENAINDIYNYSGITAPIEMHNIIVRTARIVIEYTNADNGTFTNALSGAATQDQRNYPIGTSGGAGVGGFDYTKIPLIPQTTTPLPVAEGTIYTDANKHNLVVQTDTDASMDIGRETWVRAYNGTGSTITNGMPVYILSGTTEGSEVVVTIALARSDAKVTCSVMGVTTQEILNGEYGEVTVHGKVHDVDLSAYAVGDTLYVSSTVAGQYVTTIPSAPNFEARIGKVLSNSATTGVLLVYTSTDTLSSGGGSVETVVAGPTGGITVDATDPTNPIIDQDMYDSVVHNEAELTAALTSSTIESILINGADIKLTTNITIPSQKRIYGENFWLDAMILTVNGSTRVKNTKIDVNGTVVINGNQPFYTRKLMNRTSTVLTYSGSSATFYEYTNITSITECTQDFWDNSNVNRVDTIIAGTGIAVNSTDPNNPIITNSIPEITKEPTGFQTPENVIVTYNLANRTVTLTGTVVAYWRGAQITELTSGWVSPAHTVSPTTGLFLYYNGTSFIWAATPWLFDVVQIAYIAYSATSTFAFGIRECHGYLMSSAAHKEFHETNGTYRTTGTGSLSAYTLNSTTVADRRPYVATCNINDEDLLTINQSLITNTYNQFYLTGTGTASFVVDAADILALNGNVPYVNTWNGTTWSNVALSNNNYMSIWLIAVPTTADSASQKMRYLWMMGQNIFTSLSTARADDPRNINFGTFTALATESVVITQIIVRYTASNWRLIDVININGTRISQISSPNTNGQIDSIVAGASGGVSVDATDPRNPIVDQEIYDAVCHTDTELRAALESTTVMSIFISVKNVIFYLDLTIGSDKNIFGESFGFSGNTVTSNYLIYCRSVMNTIGGTVTINGTGNIYVKRIDGGTVTYSGTGALYYERITNSTPTGLTQSYWDNTNTTDPSTLVGNVAGTNKVSKIEVVTALPGTPDSSTLYFILA